MPELDAHNRKRSIMSRWIRMLAIAGLVGGALSACVVVPHGGYYGWGRSHGHGGHGHGHGHGH